MTEGVHILPPTVKPSFSTDGQAVDADGGTGDGAAEFEVVSDFRDVEEKLFQISGDRDLFHGISEFAIGNPETGSAARIVAGDEVHALAEKFGDVETFLNFGDELL
jgi:hypothetical protein